MCTNPTALFCRFFLQALIINQLRDRVVLRVYI